jgi:hypothetical protein
MNFSSNKHCLLSTESNAFQSIGNDSVFTGAMCFPTLIQKMWFWTKRYCRTFRSYGRSKFSYRTADYNNNVKALIITLLYLKVVFCSFISLKLNYVQFHFM